MAHNNTSSKAHHIEQIVDAIHEVERLAAWSSAYRIELYEAVKKRNAWLADTYMKYIVDTDEEHKDAERKVTDLKWKYSNIYNEHITE